MKKFLPFILFSCIAFFNIHGQVVFTPVVSSGLLAITDIESARDGSGKLYIVERRGVIRIVNTATNTILAQQFLSIQDSVMDDGNERGLLGLAFHPNYPASPYIYVNYVREGTIINRIARFTVPAGSPDNATETSMLVLMDILGLQSNHKAGDMAFGPDGYLYIGTGDGGGGGDPGDNGQDTTERLGKILRINVDVAGGGNNYTSPSDNPFFGGGSGLDEIWMYGLRNPWRFSFDRNNGDFWIADVGQNLREEVNWIPNGTGAGLNLGWDCREGFDVYDPPTPSYCNGATFTPPIYQYPHNCTPEPCPEGNSITGGFVSRGNDYPDLEGLYLAIDYVSGDLFIFEQVPPGSGNFTVTLQNSTGGPNYNITTFGEDDDGELYAGNLSGILYRVSMGTLLPLQWEDLDATPIGNGNRIRWTLHNFLNVDYFEVQRSATSDFTDFVKLVNVIPNPDENSYSYDDPYIHTDGAFYRIAAYINDGSIEYSPIARILPDPLSKPSLTFDFNHNMWRIQLPPFWQNGDLILYDLQGRVMYKTNLDKKDHIDLSKQMPAGVYFISLRSNEGTWSNRIVR